MLKGLGSRDVPSLIANSNKDVLYGGWLGKGDGTFSINSIPTVNPTQA